MDIEKLLIVAIIFAYSFGAFGILLGTLSMRRAIKDTANKIAVAGACLHTVYLALALSSQGFDDLSAAVFMQLLAWFIIVLYLVAWRWLRLPFLGLTAAPLALLLFILSLRFSNVQGILPENFSGLFMGLHIWALYISIGLLAMAFGAGVLFVYTESKLKKKMPLAEFTRDMPSLSTYDKVNKIAVLAGFPLFTLGVISGFIWAPIAKDAVGSPKVLISLFIWLLYALLFYQRTALRYRGRKTAVMAITIFLISLCSILIDYALLHHSSQLLPQLLP